MKKTKFTKFSFGVIPEEYRESPDGRIDDYYFTVDIATTEQEIKISDTCGRMVPMCFEHIRDFRKVLKKVMKEIDV